MRTFPLPGFESGYAPGHYAPVTVLDVPRVDAIMARELAVAQKVCARPLIRRVQDRLTGADDTVALPCGSTQERVCPACADKNRRLRMQQCAEGWHRSDELPELPPATDGDDQADHEDEDEDEDDEPTEDDELTEDDADDATRRVRSTRRRQDVPELPRVPMDKRTIGRVFTADNGREYRPSMFVTLTMPSYGKVGTTGAPLNPDLYDYRRQALDTLLFPRLVGRFFDNLRRVAGYKVQYFGAIEPQKRLAPHYHCAIRGAIPHQLLRKVAAATYESVWWPPFDQPVYVHRVPIWDGSDYVDADTGEVLPTWREALDRAELGKPAHVLRFGRQVDSAGIIAPSPDADKAIRYLTKYLTKSVSSGPADGSSPDPRWISHVDRMEQELQYLPCSERCANWLRYGVQPMNPGPGLRAGHCLGKAHDRDHLGLGGRRVLVSRQWSGKTLTQHRADRATVVRETLLSAGVIAPETERLAATVTLPDGTPRFLWSDTRPDPATYARTIVASIVERNRWRAQYTAAKTQLIHPFGPVDNRSATGPPAA